MTNRNQQAALYPWREHALSPDEVQRGVQTLTAEIFQAIDKGKIDGANPQRCIYEGINIDGVRGLFPLRRHPWANNRAVAQGVVEVCQKRGYRAAVVEPRWLPLRRSWRALGFAIFLPDDVHITTCI